VRPARLLAASLAAALLCSLGGVPAPGGADAIVLGAAVFDMIFDMLRVLRDEGGKTLVLVEQNARKGLEFADVGYVLVAGRLAKAGHGKELLADPDMRRLFLGG